MPSKSPAQARLMAAVAHGWKPPRSSGIHVPMKVAKEFNKADEGSHMLAKGMKQKRASMMGKIVGRRSRQLRKG
jgi:hypothetical protein